MSPDVPDVPDVPDADKFPGWPLVAGGGDEDDAAGAEAAGGDAPDGGDGSTPDGGEPDGGSGDDSVDLEDVAAAFDQEALAEMAAADDDGGQPDAGEGEGSGKGKGAGRRAAASDPLDEFISKHYQGDRAAFVHSLGESQREARRLAAEIENLKAAHQPRPQTRDTAAELKAARDTDSEVQALDQDIKQVDQTVTAIQRRQLELTGLATRVNEEIAALEAELPYIEDPKEQAKKNAKLVRLHSNFSSYQSEFQTNDARLEQQGRAKAQAVRELKRAEQTVKDRLQQEEESERDETVSAERTRKHFETAFQIHIKPYSLDGKSGTYKYAHASVRTILADYLESLGDEHDTLDAAEIYEHVGKLVAAWADASGKKPAAAAPSKPKPRVPVPPQPQRQKMVPLRPVSSPASAAAAVLRRSTLRTADDVLDDPDLVRKRAAAVFSAAARTNARKGVRGIA